MSRSFAAFCSYLSPFLLLLLLFLSLFFLLCTALLCVAPLRSALLVSFLSSLLTRTLPHREAIESQLHGPILRRIMNHPKVLFEKRCATAIVALLKVRCCFLFLA